MFVKQGNSSIRIKPSTYTKKVVAILLTFTMVASLCFGSGLTAFAEEAKDAAPDPGAAAQKAEESASLSEGILAAEQSAQQNQTNAEEASVNELVTGAIDDVLAANASGTPLSEEGDASLQADEGTAAANKMEATEAVPAAPQASPAETDSAIVPLAEDDIASGTCGTCSWVIDKDGLLTIRPTDGGSGTLQKPSGGSSANWPWQTFSPNGANAITAVVIENGVSAATDSSYMFAGMGSLVSADLSNLDTYQVTNMQAMFNGCSSLSSLDVSGFDTSKVTDMRWMFSGCSSLPSLDVSGFDTSKVTNMNRMFSGCSSLPSLDVSGFDTSKVTNMSLMFNDCFTLSSLDVSGFDTAQVTNMRSMFSVCSSLPSLDVSGFDTSKVTDMALMFNGCSSLPSLDVSGFDTSKVTDMSWMFNGCSSLLSLDVSGFDTSQVTNMGLMFNDCSTLSSLDVSGFDTSKVTNMRSMFSVCSSLPSLDVSGFDTSKVTDMALMFNGCSSLPSLDVSGFDTSKVTDMSWMFNGCSSLPSLDVSGFDTSKVTNMSLMFNDCSSLPSLDVSGFDTSQVTNMRRMFYGCSSLPSLDVSGFDTSQVTDMSLMFNDCSSLPSLDVSNFDMSQVVDETHMLANCSKLSELTLGEKCKLDLHSDTQFAPNMAFLPDPPTTEPYTGKWILEGGDMPMTAAELMANYPNAATGYPVGTYVWEKDSSILQPLGEYSVSYSVTGEVPEGYTVPTDTKLYAEGDAITVAAIPTAEGYTFDGWKLDGTVVTDATMGTADMTLTGTWSKLPDTVEEPQAQSPVVTKPKTEPAAAAAKTVSASPKTGDSLSLIAIALGLASLACAAGVFGLRRRRQH